VSGRFLEHSIITYLALFYASIDLSLPVNGSIDRVSPSWSSNILDLYIGTIDAFSKYDNVLAYNVGNEVTIAPDGSDSDVAAYVKAAARDTKAYLWVHNPMDNR
jgi:fructose-1,6-bisphosphatase/sedoheptulose 1,7-bisphosphatase-like protein